MPDVHFSFSLSLSLWKVLNIFPNCSLKKIFILLYVCVCGECMHARTSLCSEEGVGSLKLQAVIRCWELNWVLPVGGVSALTTHGAISPDLCILFLILSLFTESEACCIGQADRDPPVSAPSSAGVTDEWPP